MYKYIDIDMYNYMYLYIYIYTYNMSYYISTREWHYALPYREFRRMLYYMGADHRHIGHII